MGSISLAEMQCVVRTFSFQLRAEEEGGSGRGRGAGKKQRRAFLSQVAQILGDPAGLLIYAELI